MYLYPENNVEIKRKKHFGTFSFDSCFSTRLPPNPPKKKWPFSRPSNIAQREKFLNHITHKEGQIY
jgi:hypothetical protein